MGYYDIIPLFRILRKIALLHSQKEAKMAAGERSPRLASGLVFFASWGILFFSTYSPEPTNTYRFPIADVSGNVNGDPYETGRLFTRWQTQGAMENSLENFIAIPWGASLVYYEDAEDYR